MQNRKTFFVSFFLRRDRVMKNGTAPIMARISVNGIAREVYTQCRTPVDKWDTAKGRATGRDKLAYEVHAYIDDFRAKVVEIYRTLQAEGFEGNALEIKERLQSPGKQAKMFLEELTLYCEKRQKEVGVCITQLTSNKYYRLCRYLREYTKQECKKDDIRLSAVSYGYLDGFNTYLQTAHRCHHNGAVNILDCLRNFMLYCLRNEWVEKNPFKNYKLKEIATICGLNKKLTTHSLRHSFATRCIESKCDYKTVSVLLGHSNISTTLNLYVHPNLEQKKKMHGANVKTTTLTRFIF